MATCRRGNKWGVNVTAAAGAAARASIPALAMLALAASAAFAGGGDTTSGLPIPRFVSIKTDRVNVRGGPDKDHDVAWIYTRVGWPVEITAKASRPYFS